MEIELNTGVITDDGKTAETATRLLSTEELITTKNVGAVVLTSDSDKFFNGDFRKRFN